MGRPNLAMAIRDELGQVYDDAAFVSAFGTRGRPGISPAQLTIVSVLQFAEDLTDRRAAEAVRDRISWKYALGLELDDPGFDASVLSEFRARLVDGDLVDLPLDALLERLVSKGLLKSGGRARTDSTHVLGAIRSLNRLELAGETVRAALEALAVAAPDWLAGTIDAGWQDRYGARVDSMHQPDRPAARAELMTRYGTDGYNLLDAVHAPDAPTWLRELPAVQMLRRIWVQQFYRDVDATTGRQEVRRREQDDEGLPPGQHRLISPYDPDARYSTKRGHGWAGYKLHVTETCGPAPTPDPTPDPTQVRLHLVTDVLTTEATSPDVTATKTVHDRLRARGLLPEEHLVDSGYPTADLVVRAAADYGITLVSPLLTDRSAQARAGKGYDKAAFTIDFDARRATCPQGVASSSWTPGGIRDRPVVVLGWPETACRPCPARTDCTRSTRRRITLQPREIEEALATARAQETTAEWRARYAARAGVEGTVHQITHDTGVRRTRYRGLPKIRLEHVLATTAVNLIRLHAYWTGHPLERTRTTHLARLNLTPAAA
jgi:transposase